MNQNTKTKLQNNNTERIIKSLVSGFARTGNELACIDSNLSDICNELKAISASLKSLDKKGIRAWNVDGGI